MRDDFFCSELTAKTSKTLGILDRTMDSAQVWPSTFAKGSSSKSTLSTGCDLDNELMIDFSLRVSAARKIGLEGRRSMGSTRLRSTCFHDNVLLKYLSCDSSV